MAKDESSEIRPRHLLLRLAVLVACVFLWPALITFDAGDYPSPHQFPYNNPPANACGALGAWCAYYLYHLLGDGAFPLLLFATLASILKLVHGEIRNLPERLFGLALFTSCTAAAVHLVPTSIGPALPEGHGGLVGYALGEFLRTNLNPLGTFIVLGSCLFVGLLFATDGWVLKLPSYVRKAGEATGTAVLAAKDLAHSAARSSAALATIGSGGGDTALKPARRTEKRGGRGRRTVVVEEDEPQLPFEDAEDPGEDAYEDDVEEPADVEPDIADDEEEDDSAPADAENVQERKAPSRKPPTVPVLNRPTPRRPAAEAYPKQIENWTLPSIELLEEPTYDFSEQQEEAVREQAHTLERTLEEFRLDARVVAIDTGPVITMFELRLGAGIKVSQIASLANDIARALKAHAIRVVAPIPGKNTVGIEVPNLSKETVRLRELMTSAGKRASGMRLPLFLGKNASGEPLVTDLTKMPHLLIAGTTGSGKSVCINSIVLSLLMTKRPDHVKLIMVDPKMVEMSQFKDVPHLMCPIVTDLMKAEKILEWAVTKMEERYAQLAECRVRNIAEYNNLGQEGVFARLQPANDEERKRISTRLPYVVIIIDELADLMMTSGKEVEHHLSRLAQKSRAVGIHIIVATQRPEAKVVTGLIKSNMPCRISFRVASRMDSRIVLDQNGGEVLMGQGDMLFLPPGTHKLMRAQGTFLGNDEIQEVLDDLAERAKPEFHPELVRLPGAGQEGGCAVRDPLFEKAVDIVIETKRGSVSLLQRRLEIGYSRASRLIDQMADAGIVGEYKGSQAREVVLTAEEWQALRQQVERDLEANFEADQLEFEDMAEDAAEDEEAQDDEERSDESDWEEDEEDEGEEEGGEEEEEEDEEEDYEEGDEEEEEEEEEEDDDEETR